MKPGQAVLRIHGLRQNWFQFSLLALLTMMVGATIGVERVALPPLAQHAFGVTSVLYTVSFVSAFGVVKAIMNLVSGRLSDRRGRKLLLLAGWGFAVPYAVLIIFAQNWIWVLVANMFLGVNQALTWTMSVTAMIDLVGPVNRGLAVGINEAAGYVGVGLGGFAAGLLVVSYGLRPAPYLLALGIVGLGGAITIWPTRETLPFARAESELRAAAVATTSPAAAGPMPGADVSPGLGRLAVYMSWHDRSMLAVCQGGFLNKFADSLVIGFFPLYLLQRGLSLLQVGLVVGVYAWVWGLGQVATGALADRVGRRLPIASGILTVGAAVALIPITSGLGPWLGASALMGVGMALVYPNLISAVGDVAHPAWRGGALGVYRFWRDGGYAVGPLVLGGLALAFGLVAAFWAMAFLMGLSGAIVIVLMRETAPSRRRQDPAWQGHPEWIYGAAAGLSEPLPPPLG
ncbi:MAG: MFS transporter [Candidatus Dormibacteraeota bacterium]|nr:MFS transporter [Candidatus Dormibacteraeota bacterium]